MKDPYSNATNIKIYAHENLIMEAERADTFKSIKSTRTNRMFAPVVPSPWHINDVAAERLLATGPYQILYPPTDAINFPYGQKRVSMVIAGKLAGHFFKGVAFTDFWLYGWMFKCRVLLFQVLTWSL